MTLTALPLDIGVTPSPGDETATASMTVALVEHDRLFARGLELLLHDVSGGRVRVIGDVDEASAAVDLVRHRRPDVLIVGMSLPPPGGLAAIAEVKRTYPAVRVLALSASDDVDVTVAALRAGADGVLLKSSPPEALVAPLLALAAGLCVIPGPMVGALVDGPVRRDHECLRRLSADERRLWRLVADGLDTLAIARHLFISERTAKRRINYLLRRLAVDNRIQAAALAGRCGLLDQTPG
ncbi:MAG: response regulator [Acidimicrobiia bacterium]